MSRSVFHGDPERIGKPDPQLTPELLAFVRDRYGLPITDPVDLGGAFNLNVRLGERVLRVYGPWVEPQRLIELQRIRRVLSARSIPLPQLLSTAQGETWCQFEDCVLEVEGYVRGDRMGGTAGLRAGMVQLGRLHDQLADLDIACPPPVANHLPQERAVDATAAATDYIRSHDPTPLDERYCRVAEQLAALLPVCDLPTQLVHGDYWDNNVLLRGDTVAAVLDLDFADVRPRIDDLAIPFGNLMHAGQPADRIVELIAAYESGTVRPLTPTERAALPFAMARAALFFLQYLLIPADEAHTQQQRREFREQRGPTCEWWLHALTDSRISATSFRRS